MHNEDNLADPEAVWLLCFRKAPCPECLPIGYFQK